MHVSDLVGQYNQTTTSGPEKLTGTKGVENLVSSLRSLTKGNIFEGTVSSMKNGRVTLALSNGQQVSARMEGKVALSVGQSMFFQVKSNDGTQIAIRPFVGASLAVQVSAHRYPGWHSPDVPSAAGCCGRSASAPASSY